MLKTSSPAFFSRPIASHLGEKACEMLCNYLEEEITSSIYNCSQSSPMWSNGLQRKLITSCCDTLSSVAKSAMQHFYPADQHIGRCQCEVNWSDLPSFLGDVGAIASFLKRYQHDGAVSFRSATLKTITDNAHHIKMTKVKSMLLC